MVGAQHQGYQVVRGGEEQGMVGAQHQGYQVVRGGEEQGMLERNTKATKLLEEGGTRNGWSAIPRLPSC